MKVQRLLLVMAIFVIAKKSWYESNDADRHKANGNEKYF